MRRSGTRSSARFEEGKTGSGSSWTESPELWTREDCAREKRQHRKLQRSLTKDRTSVTVNERYVREILYLSIIATL